MGTAAQGYLRATGRFGDGETIQGPQKNERKAEFPFRPTLKTWFTSPGQVLRGGASPYNEGRRGEDQGTDAL